MTHALLVPIAVMTTAAAPAGKAAPVETAIRSAMEASVEGWNRGDLARFMQVYADDAVFVTPKGLLRGKAAIAAKYRPSFVASGNARGTLSFAFLEVRALDSAHALLIARWTLTASASTETGMTSLVFARQGAVWKIVADHSS